jgi:integrase
VARRTRLTDDDVKKLTRPEGTLYVTHVLNLYIRFGKKTKTYYTVVRQPGGKQRWERIGRVDRITIKAAEEEAGHFVERIREGKESRQVAPGEVTLKTIATAFEVKLGRHQRRWKDKERRLKNWLLPRFGKVPFLDITRSQVKELLNTIGETSPRTADQVLVDLQALERFFDDSMGCAPDDYVMRFRGKRIKKQYEGKPRERVFSHKELAAVWVAADDAGRFGVIVKLCLLSGQRITKILEMKWNDLDDSGQWTIPRTEREKGAPKVLPLPPAAIKLIKTQARLTPYVFYSMRGDGRMVGLSELKRDFVSRLLPMERWGLHDLRRSCRTLMQQVKPKIGFETAEAILGHKIKGVAATYAHHDYVPEMKIALTRLAAYIEKIVRDNAVPAATTAAVSALTKSCERELTQAEIHWSLEKARAIGEL